MDEREPSPEGGHGAASGAGRTGPDGKTTEADAGTGAGAGADAEELSQLRAERDRLLAERDRLRHELNGPPSHPPRILPQPPPHSPADKHRATLSVPGGPSIAQLAFSPDGRTLATLGFQDKMIHLWRLE
ncbi:hypothetical protein [Streptomyces antimycoticus]|nr:hypothetical protein [Streptomyces antimycoticus]